MTLKSTLKPIGASGFGYTTTGKETIGGSKKHGYHYGWNCIVKNIKTNKHIFTIVGGYRCTPYCKNFIGTKKFLGLDNKYYYIQIGQGNVDWGQVQPSGAVLRSNRTILTTLAFYPVYKETPEPKPVIKNVVMTPKVVIEKVPEPKIPIKNIPMTPALIVEDREEKSWINNLIKQIQNLINQIISLLKS